MSAAAMKLVPLQEVAAKLRVGAPLPFGVRDAQGKLLLARGLLVASEQMLQALLDRGVFVDLDEVREGRGAALAPTPGEDFFGRWQALQTRLSGLLRSPGERFFLQRLRECVAAVASLSERNADQLIFVVMRHDHSRYAVYGTAHSLHVAAVCSLLAQRWGWPRDKHESLLGAALTMNLSIIELQGRLASRGGALTAEQRAAIDSHPADSAALLREAGLTDADWLEAVAQHHECDGGGGYPAGIAKPGELSQLLRFVDIFTAKHAGRAGRAPMPAQQAARELYTASAGHPVAAMLIKEFGIFPPGCFVKLASGETAIVVRRGAGANTPLVAAITNRNGDALAAPLRRDTARPEFAIAGTIVDKAVLVQVPVDKLYEARNDL
jgi:hypothetical protein